MLDQDFSSFSYKSPVTPPVTPPEENFPMCPENLLFSAFDQTRPSYRSYFSLHQNNNGVELKSSNTGFFSGEFSLFHDDILNLARSNNQCDARLIRIRSKSTENGKALSTHGIVNLIEPCGISIISDIDDTIKDTRISSGARTVLSKTFFEASKEVDGMASAYMLWYNQGASFHYVSNSPFQLIPMLDQFIRHSQFPPGSMHLRDEASLLSRLVEVPGQAKREAILEIIHDFPQRQFVLIGDSGEIDLEIYTKIALENPDRILKIFIRDVTSPVAEGKKKKAYMPNQLSAILYQSSSSLFSFSKKDVPPTLRTSKSAELKKIIKSSLGIKKTTAIAEYVVEPHLASNKSVHSEDENSDILIEHQAEACIQLYERVERARLKLTNIDVILFQHADVLHSDPDIQNALWKS